MVIFWRPVKKVGRRFQKVLGVFFQILLIFKVLKKQLGCFSDVTDSPVHFAYQNHPV